MTRRLLLLGGGALAAAVLYPFVASAPNLDRAALSLALAGPAVGAALASAAGRPPLFASALAGTGAYVSALLSLHGVPVPLAALTGAGAGAAVAAAAAAVCTWLEPVGFLVVTLLLALCGGAVVQALPSVTGAEAGLGPLPPPSLPLSATQTAQLTPLGDFHLMVAVAALGAAIASLLLGRGPGPRWRAVGSDRSRAAATGISVLAAEASALAVAGALAGLSGALGAHVARVATPQGFALDVAALPLLAALAAGRQPIGAALVAVATGVAGYVLLPAAGWQGPPDAASLAIGVLAVVAAFTLFPGGPSREVPEGGAIGPDAPWPLRGPLVGASLAVPALRVTAPGGALMLEAPAVTVEAGAVLAIVGPNGAGKTTFLRTVLARSRREPVATAGDRRGRVALLPQEGGGFAFCTVVETLRLAAATGRGHGEAREVAAAWLARLGLDADAHRPCAELSGGRRRLLDLARVLLTGPNLLLCDEPLAGLDDSHRAAAVSLLRAASREGLTIVVAEHDAAATTGLAGAVLELRGDAVSARAPAAT